MDEIKVIGQLLTNSDNFKRVCDMSEYDVPKSPGLYAIKIKDTYDIGNPYRAELIDRKHNLLYIGICRKSLRKRLWKQELNDKGAGTFFRSIGTILGFRPLPGTLKSKANYKFSKDDTEIIKNWINEHLTANYVVYPMEKLKDTEKMLIIDYSPLLNIEYNPKKMKILEEHRKACIAIAKSL